MDLMKIRNGLDDFDVDHLKRMYALLFDMWCWEDNNENLKQLLDMIDSRLAELDIGASVGVLPDKPIFRIESNPSNGSKAVVLHSNEQSFDYTIFEISSNGFGSPEIGYELASMLKEFINKEMFGMSGNNYELTNSFNNAVMNQTFILQQDIDALRERIDILELSKINE